MTTNEMTVDMTVDRIKLEIEEYMRTGRVPRQVSNLAQLDDYIDMNTLGGLCEDEIFDGLIAHFGGRDEHEGMPQGMIDFLNEVQEAVNHWLLQRSESVTG